MKHPPVEIRRITVGLKIRDEISLHRIFLISDGVLRIDGAAKGQIAGPCVASVPEGAHVLADDRLSGAFILLERGFSSLMPRFTSLRESIHEIINPESVVLLRLSSDHLETLCSIAGEIESEIQVRGVAYEAATIARCIDLIVSIHRYRAGDIVNDSRETDVWTPRDVMTYVQEHYNEVFSLAEVAGKCALNTTSFSREFKRTSGSPLFEYINKVRVRSACVLLKHSTKSILQVATEVGYNNVSFFNRYFRRIMGMSPSRYRVIARS